MGVRGENPGAFPKGRPIFQQPISLPENAQTLAGIALCAAGTSVNNFQQRRSLPENFSSSKFLTATAFSSFLRFSLFWITKAKAKENFWDLICFRRCGLQCLWLPNMIVTKVRHHASDCVQVRACRCKCVQVQARAGAGRRMLLRHSRVRVCAGACAQVCVCGVCVCVWEGLRLRACMRVTWTAGWLLVSWQLGHPNAWPGQTLKEQVRDMMTCLLAVLAGQLDDD